METLVRVSRHRKCSGSIDLIEADCDWIERQTKRKPPYGISCYMLSFGDLDNPELDCEIYLTAFELAKLQEYLNTIDVHEIPDCQIKPQTLNIIIKATASNLETCSFGQSLSRQMHCVVWKHKSHPTDIKQEPDDYWILEFMDFHLGIGSDDEGDYHSTQIQVECASFQLAELRGAINGLLSQMKKGAPGEQREIDREARDNKIRKDKEDKRKRYVEAVKSTKSAAHRGSC